MNKKLLLAIVMIAAVLVLAGCFGKKQAPQPAPAPAPGPVVQQPAAPVVPVAPAVGDERVVEAKTTATKTAEEMVTISPRREEAIARGCVDTDGGFNVKEQGTVNDAKGSVKQDQCSRSEVYKNQLYEYHCGEDGGYVRVYYDCENGCMEGACVE